MRKTKYPPETVERLCLEALAEGGSMSKAVALFFAIDVNSASTLIAKVRNLGYDIPILRVVDQTDWETKRANHVNLRRRLLMCDHLDACPLNHTTRASIMYCDHLDHCEDDHE